MRDGGISVYLLLSFMKHNHSHFCPFIPLSYPEEVAGRRDWELVSLISENEEE